MAFFPTEVRHVLRRLLRAPLFTAITLITLGVGIGANTAIFSVLYGVLLKPLPYAEPDRLIGIWHTAKGLGLNELNASPSTYFTYREQSQTFQDTGLWRRDSDTVSGLAEPEHVDTLYVTEGLLPLLGVQPRIGRPFSKKDDSPGSPETVMLTYGYWQRRFGGDPNVIGRRLLVNSKAREIVGVLPESFQFMSYHPSLVLPFQLDRSKVFIGNFSYQQIGRLKPGVTLDQATADVARMIPIMGKTFPPPPGFDMHAFEKAGFGPNLRPLKRDVVGDVGKVLWILMAVVGIVLLIACANVANLMLVRAEVRQQEFAIRTALGAGRSQIARELLLESTILGLSGGALGLGLAYAAVRALIAIGPATLPRLDEIAVNFPALLFTLAISVFAGLLFGFIPVLKYAGARLGTALREGGRSLSDGKQRIRARNVLVVVQVALALVLLISSGLMIRTAQALRHVAPGFTNPESVLTIRIFIPDALVPDPQRVARLDYDILQKLNVISGVTSVAVSDSVAMDGNGDHDPVYAEDHPDTSGRIPVLRNYRFISPGAFHTLGNPFLAGRDFTWTDIFDLHPVVLVSENLARELWGSPGAAIGKRVRERPNGIWREIVGVVGDEHADGVDRPAPKMIFWPFVRKDFWEQGIQVDHTLAFIIRSDRVGSSTLLSQVRQAVWSLNASLPIANVRTMAEIYDRSMARTSFTLLMLSIAGGMALLLGVVGIYGVISYSISQRTREIGIRMALGAPQPEVARMFVRHGLTLTGAGIGFGLVAAFLLTRLMSSLLFGVQPIDPMTYAAVSAFLAASALVASYFPARRASLIDPVNALKAE